MGKFRVQGIKLEGLEWNVYLGNVNLSYHIPLTTNIRVIQVL